MKSYISRKLPLVTLTTERIFAARSAEESADTVAPFFADCSPGQSIRWESGDSGEFWARSGA
jgi:hypothetical protein